MVYITGRRIKEKGGKEIASSINSRKRNGVACSTHKIAPIANFGA